MKKYNPKRTMKEIESLMSVSTGNRKLVSNDKVQFLIWNLPAIKTCPFATDHCKDLCYARKAEIAYPGCLKSRQRNLEFSKSDMFVDVMIDFISIKLNNLKPGRKIFFRIHESGDFYSVEYLKKWIQIIEYFKADARIIFQGYTKSIAFVAMLNLTKEYRDRIKFRLRYSIWDDTKMSELRLAKEYDMPTYTALTREEMDMITSRYHECRCADCATCAKCYSKEQTIICEIH